MIQRLAWLFLFAVFGSQSGWAEALRADAGWIEDLDYSHHADQLRPKRSVRDTPLTIAGRVYEHGFGGVGRARLLIQLDGRARRLVGTVGIDDIEDSNGSKVFEVWLDDRLAATSGVLRKGQAAALDVDLHGVRVLELVIQHGGIESDWDRFVLGDMQLVLAAASAADRSKWPQPYALVPEPAPALARRETAPLSINGPRVAGGTPGLPFLHRLAVSGRGPITIEVRNLPATITFDAVSRSLRGTLPAAGRFPVEVQAHNDHEDASTTLTLIGGHTADVKALTPVLGWNSWNVWGKNVDAGKIRAAAQALLKSGLADHGFSYVNIDDGWASGRDATGRLTPIPAFGDVAGLARDVHALGLKLGLYSSPGPATCAGFTGSYGHEMEDARTFAAWGVDLLKYDWCSYGGIAPNLSPAEQRRPYAVMQAALAAAPRDIVYSVCNYGRGEVWSWGRAVGANLWRTTSDIGDSWSSLEGIAFAQDDKAPCAGPGHVNDPDMLVVGRVGWGEHHRPSGLSANEQILHLTHWAMLAAPLLLGCELEALDDFTLDLLSNDEVLAVDQDELVQSARRRQADGRTEVWSRPLADGGLAVALYNRGPAAAVVTARFSDLGRPGPQAVRNLWQRRDLGLYREEFSTQVPQHGAVLVKLGRPATVPAR